MTPVGDHRSIFADVRVISATNRDLEQEVIEGRFREDLFYRLNAVKLTATPLSSRVEDIPLPCHFFLGQWSADNGLPAKRLSAEALRVLMAHDWPGNVRQLHNVLERAALFSDGEEISVEQFARLWRNSGRGPADAGPALGESDRPDTPPVAFAAAARRIRRLVAKLRKRMSSESKARLRDLLRSLSHELETERNRGG